MPIELIVRIIEETLTRFGSTASYDQYRLVAFDLYPEEMRTMSGSFARQGFIKWFKSGMRHTLNEGEDVPDGLEIQMDLLPGLAAPAYLNIGTWVSPRPKRFGDCTVADLDVALNIRATVSARQTKRIEDLRQKREWLRARALSAQESISEVVRRLRGDQAAA